MTDDVLEKITEGAMLGAVPHERPVTSPARVAVASGKPVYALTLSCPDCPGIIAAVSSYLFQAGCTILDAQQFDDAESNRFFMRVLFTPVEGEQMLETLAKGFDPMGNGCR